MNSFFANIGKNIAAKLPIPPGNAATGAYRSDLLRACPCKNRPLKFSWKMDCLHYFYTSQATYAMSENGLYFGRFAFLIF